MAEGENHPLVPFLEKIDGLHNKKVLDVGAGPHQPVVDAYAILCGDESARNNVVSLDKIYDDKHLVLFTSPLAVGAKAESLPFEKSSFDVITMISLLHILQTDDVMEKGISESLRVLKPGGTLIVCYATLKPRIDKNSKLAILIKVALNDRKLEKHMDTYRQGLIKGGFKIQEESNDYNWGAVLANFIAIKPEASKKN